MIHSTFHLNVHCIFLYFIGAYGVSRSIVIKTYFQQHGCSDCRNHRIFSQILCRFHHQKSPKMKQLLWRRTERKKKWKILIPLTSLKSIDFFFISVMHENKWTFGCNKINLKLTLKMPQKKELIDPVFVPKIVHKIVDKINHDAIFPLNAKW